MRANNNRLLYSGCTVCTIRAESGEGKGYIERFPDLPKLEQSCFVLCLLL